MLSQSDRTELASLLYPDVTQTPADFEKTFPPRQLPEDAIVTRFAPSPTGFVHIGGIYASLISKLLADQSGGLFYLRIEDTDQRREIEGGTKEIINALHSFRLPPDEGYVAEGRQAGEYQPYVQSQRAEIYHAYAKWLVENDFAYPCFCSEEELAEMARQQTEAQLQKKGYFGKWAKYRNASLDEIKTKLAEGNGFVLRVKAPEETKTVECLDLIRGTLRVESNMFDMVLIKSNGLPTYHFAHVVDDHLMRTTHVTRGEEWLSTLPLHIQLFEMFGMKTPVYLHFSHIGKKEGTSVRKLSKRKDPEAAVSLYTETGYPPVAVLEYLLNLANSNFSEWREQNPTLPYKDFPFEPKKIGKAIALFDQKKLDNISGTVISNMTAEDVYIDTVTWAREFNPEFAAILERDRDYSVSIFNIERNQERPRKDIVTWSNVSDLIWYFFDDQFEARTEHTFSVPETVAKEDAAQALQFFIDHYDETDDKDAWTEKCRTMAESNGYARDVKTFKQNPSDFKGHIGHLMSIIRLALTHQTNTPDLFQVMQVMGKRRVLARLMLALEGLDS